MGDPSDDDVPTMTSSADLRKDGDGSGADAEDRTIQKPPEAVEAIEAIEQEAQSERDRTLMAIAPKVAAAPSPPASAPRPAAGLPAVPADKLPPPPTNPLRPRMPSTPSLGSAGPASAGMRPRSASSPGIGPASSKPVPAAPSVSASASASTATVGSSPMATGAATATAAATAAAPVPANKADKKSDSKSDVRTMSASTAARQAEDDGDGEGPPTLESEPPPSEPATSPKSPAMMAASSPSPVTPKMPGAPKSAGAAKVSPPSAKKTSLPRLNDEDGEPTDDSITATAPRVPAPNIPLSAPKQVEIRTLEEADADETEVKTLSAEAGHLVKSAREQTAREKASAQANEANKANKAKVAHEASEADAADDSVTAQAPLPPSQMAGKGPPAVIRISPASLVSPQGNKGAKYNPEEEDSVTARGLELGYRGDRVTAQGPSGGLPPSIEGETEGTTKRVRKSTKSPSSGEATEADEADDSVTAAAPGHLTNMLRVIASPTEASEDEEQADDDPLYAHTQVMANAPVKPPDYARRGAPDQRPPDSESGLRVSRPDGMNGERASLGALGVPAGEPRHSAPMRSPYESSAAMGPSPSDGLNRSPFGPMPSMAPDDRRPPYALLVGVVAIVSIAIPVLLFVILSQGGSDPAPRVVSQPSPDPVGVTGPRPKAKTSPSGSPTSVHTASGGGGGRSPFRR